LLILLLDKSTELAQAVGGASKENLPFDDGLMMEVIKTSFVFGCSFFKRIYDCRKTCSMY